MPADSGLPPLHIVWTKSGARRRRTDRSESALFCSAHGFSNEVEADPLYTSFGIDQRIIVAETRINSMINPTPNEEITPEVIARGARDAAGWQKYHRVLRKAGLSE